MSVRQRRGKETSNTIEEFESLVVTEVKPVVTDVKPVILAEQPFELTSEKAKSTVGKKKTIAEAFSKFLEGDEDDWGDEDKADHQFRNQKVEEEKDVKNVPEEEEERAEMNFDSEYSDKDGAGEESECSSDEEADLEPNLERLLADKDAFYAKRKEKQEARRKRIREKITEIKKGIIGAAKKEISIQELIGIIGKKRNLQDGEKADSDEVLDLSEKVRMMQDNKNRIQFVMLGVVVLAMIVGWGIYRQVRVFRDYKIISVQERADDNATVYISLRGYRLKCNPNGVTCLDSKNEVKWNTTFNMDRLIVDKCDSFVAVAAHRGNEVYVFNENGLQGNFKVEHLLTKIKITSQGDVATVLEDGQVTWINVYDKSGELLIKNKTSMAETGYPVDMDISPNGYKMMVSYVGVGEDIESRVIFYNFSAVGQDKEGKVVNTEMYTGHVIPEVKFMEGNYAIAFKEDGASIFRGQQIPEECNEVALTEDIISVFSDEEYFGFVTESDEENGTHKYRMTMYRENGSRCGAVYFDFEYTDIAMEGSWVVLYNAEAMQVYDMSGKLKFDGKYEKQIREVIPTSSSGKFTILTDSSIDVIRIK